MIDIKFLRENPDAVKENIRKKFQDSKLGLVDEVIALDAEVRAAQQEADEIRANRNKISKEIGALMGQGKKEEAEAKKAEVAANAARLAELEEKEKELRALLASANEDGTIPFTKDEIVNKIALDKKAGDGFVKFVLIKDAGDCRVEKLPLDKVGELL